MDAFFDGYGEAPPRTERLEGMLNRFYEIIEEAKNLNYENQSYFGGTSA